MTHIHIGALPTIVTMAEVILVMFALRWIAATWPDSAIGKAAAALH